MAAVWEFTKTGPGAIREIDDALAHFWVTHDQVPEPVRFHMRIAVGEVIANVVEHSGRAVRIRMEIRSHATAVTITVMDDGDPVDVDLDAVAMPGQMAERGRGLAMAKLLLSRLSYHRDASENHWTLVSDFGGRHGVAGSSETGVLDDPH